jgi:hypothetical protein
MAKTKLVVDKDRLQAAINKAEENGTLSGRSILWEATAKIYNEGLTENTITPSVVYLRFVEMGLTCWTQLGRRGKPMSDELKEKMRLGRVGVPIIRRSRASKLALLPDASDNFAQLRKITPERFQNLVDKIEKGSLTAAIKFLCVQCMGFEAKHVFDCKGLSCPMYLHRPYQKADESEKDTGADEPEDVEANTTQAE